MLLWKSQYIGRLHYNLYRAKQPDTTHISLNVGIIMVYKFSWLQSLPSPFPRGRKLIRSNCPWTLSLRGNVDSTLRAVNFQIVTPGWASPCLFLTPHLNPAQLQEIWSIPLYLVLVHLELVPSPFGNHVFNPFSVSVSYFFFNVYCLPKMTSLRLGDRGELAAGS